MQGLRIGRFEESITLLQSLGRLSIDLKMDHSAGNVSNNRAWVEMSTGPLRWGKFNLFDLYMLDRLSTSDDSREKQQGLNVFPLPYGPGSLHPTPSNRTSGDRHRLGPQVLHLRHHLSHQQAQRGPPHLRVLPIVEAENEQLAKAADTFVDRLQLLCHRRR